MAGFLGKAAASNWKKATFGDKKEAEKVDWRSLSVKISRRARPSRSRLNLNGRRNEEDVDINISAVLTRTGFAREGTPVGRISRRVAFDGRDVANPAKQRFELGQRNAKSQPR
jgi:hypothetical protein